MESTYIKAVSMRAEWLKWAREEGFSRWEDIGKEETKSYVHALPGYIKTLEEGDTFFMNSKFSSLVNHARQTIPDDLAFESEWLLSRQGWLWIEEPFEVPDIVIDEKGIKHKVDLTGDDTNKFSETGVNDVISEMKPGMRIRQISEKQTQLKIKVSAVGWFPVKEGHVSETGRVALPGATEFLCFQDFAKYADTKDSVSRPRNMGFGCWSYFMVNPGDKIIDRIRHFEAIAQKDGGAYTADRTTDMMHEIRWTYAAMYLMSQKLAVTLHRDVDRHTRKRGERENKPVVPFIKVISLRRLEQDRKKAEVTGKIVDWSWQWLVGGHWRNQFFPSTGENKPVFIEAYVKGPKDKPFKPEGTRIFVARR